MLKKTKDLVAGELVKVTNGPFGWAKVVKVKDNNTVEVFRPWMSSEPDPHSTTSYPMVGFEVFTLTRNNYEYEVA